MEDGHTDVLAFQWLDKHILDIGFHSAGSILEM